MIKHFLTAGLLGFLFVTPAMAAPFSITSGASTGADGAFSFMLTGDTASRTATFDYSESEESVNNIDFLSTSFTDPNASFSVSGGPKFINGLGFEEQPELFTVSDPTFPFSIGSTDGTSTMQKGYSFSFDLGAFAYPDNSFGGYELLSAQPIIDPATALPGGGVATVTGSPLSLVPLPASAPMMGGALALLGAIGIGMRRRVA